MVARKPAPEKDDAGKVKRVNEFKYIADLRAPSDYEKIRNREPGHVRDEYWSTLKVHDYVGSDNKTHYKYEWTDDYYNLLGVLSFMRPEE
jgi:hypothetical protein